MKTLVAALIAAAIATPAHAATQEELRAAVEEVLQQADTEKEIYNICVVGMVSRPLQRQPTCRMKLTFTRAPEDCMTN